MAELFGSPVNRALINVFFLTDRNKKDTGVDRTRRRSRGRSSRVGVVGAGIMGAGHRRGERQARACRSR